MTDGSTKAMVRALLTKVLTLNGTIALAGFLALIIGLFIGSPVGRIVCGMLLLVGGIAFFMSWRKQYRTGWPGDGKNQEDLYSQSPEGPMKTLLFDDFQPSSTKYQVKEVREEENVVPSTKSVQPVAVTREEKVKEFEISDFFDLDSDMVRSETEPRSEFNFLLTKVLLAVKDMLFAHSTGFFWANREKMQMVLEARATDSQEFPQNKRFTIDNDIVSQVAKNGKPQLLGRVTPATEREVILYYESPEYVKSVVAVPVFYLNGTKDQLPVGVLVADSKAEDAFGAETLSMLGQFTKLASALVKSYTEKYDLLLDSELLTSIRRMQDRVKSDPAEYTILNSLSEEANRLVNWDYLTVTMYAEDRNGWVLQKVVNKSGKLYVQPDQLVDFPHSIVGNVIKTNIVEHITDIELERRPRFFDGERVESGGSFLCVPISSFNRCYGSLTLESKTKNNFSGNEVETVYRLVENAAASLEVIYMNDLVKDFVIVDHLTGSFTKKHFLKEIEEEVQRAEDFGTELALVSIAVDNKEEQINRYGKDGFDTIVSTVAKIIRSNIRTYDVVGRQDVERMGILLVNTAASDAYVWAEKIRKQIASHIITLGGRSFSVTVSAGVCGLNEGMHKDELLSGTSQVLFKAMENGGNLVRVF
jgi:diguanylate cyclase (GGDEF)-like protein